MLSRTAIAVSTSSDFVVEGAVDFVLLGTEDRGKIVGHVVLSDLGRSRSRRYMMSLVHVKYDVEESRGLYGERCG